MQALRLAYLEALDIDVWVRRAEAATRHVRHSQPASAPAGEPAPPPVQPTPPLKSTRPDAPKPSAANPPVRFTIRCFKQGHVLALVDGPLWRHRRLLFDIARSLDSNGASERQDMVFEWPQLTSGDAGEAAAQAAFRAFLKAQTTVDTHWLAVGARVATLIGDAPRDAHVFLPDALEDLDKRTLWRNILSKR